MHLKAWIVVYIPRFFICLVTQYLGDVVWIDTCGILNRILCFEG